MAEHKEEWGSKLGVILAVAGSAVGLGNFLRFPGQAAAHGGGAFLIPYFCALFLLGLPIGWAEWAMGRYGGRKGFHSAPMVMGAIGKGAVARYFGDRVVAALEQRPQGVRRAGARHAAGHADDGDRLRRR